MTITPKEVSRENFFEGETTVQFFINPDKPQPAKGFIRAERFSVTPQIGPLTWQSFGEVTLKKEHGGVEGGKCSMFVCAPRGDLSLSAVVSFYRAPGKDVSSNMPDSPFADPNPRRIKLAPCTHFFHEKDGQIVYVYPILGKRGPNGRIIDAEGSLMGGEEFVNGGNYFFTMCVRDNGSGKFFVCDPEMEIDPLGGGD